MDFGKVPNLYPHGCWFVAVEAAPLVDVAANIFTITIEHCPKELILGNPNGDEVNPKIAHQAHGAGAHVRLHPQFGFRGLYLTSSLG